MSDSQPFELVTNFSPAGDQPQAIEKLVKGVEKGLRDQLLLGVTGSGKTYTMANVIAQTQRPTIVMAHNKTLAAQLYGEFKAFFPNNAVEYFVSYYDYYQPEAYVPSSDTFIEKDSSINDHIDQMRLSATRALLERRDAIIVATVSAIYGLGDPNAYMSMLLHVVQGDRLNRDDIIRRLVEMQYSRNELEFLRGTYRIRGEILDIFPAESDQHAIRIELFDDEVDSIRWFDPLTGKMIRKVPRVTIYPKSHYVQIGAMYKGDRSRKENLVNYGFRLPSALDNRPMKFEEWERIVPATIYVSATPARYELEKSEQIVEQVVRPTGLIDPEIEIRPVLTQVDDVLSEINNRKALNERVLVTTLTKRMAEDLTAYLKEYGVKVAYLHSDIDTVERTKIIHELRSGVHDALIGINLLREGLDMPEVSLVAILDADKEQLERQSDSVCRPHD